MIIVLYSGPEQLRLVDDYDVPLLVVANAESASITVYRIDCGNSYNTTEVGDDANIMRLSQAILIIMVTILCLY